MSKKEIETNTNIEIEGVILTSKVIRQLKSLQENDNEGVEINMESIANAICYIAGTMCQMEDDEIKTAAYHISELSSVRDHFLDFRKP